MSYDVYELKVREDKDNNYYPKLSDFIKDLNEILEKYGDNFINSNSEFTDMINIIKIYDDGRYSIDFDWDQYDKIRRNNHGKRIIGSPEIQLKLNTTKEEHYYPMLSHLINDLMEILDQYGDKHVCVEDDTGEFNTVSFKENEMYKLCFRSWNDNEE